MDKFKKAIEIACIENGIEVQDVTKGKYQVVDEGTAKEVIEDFKNYDGFPAPSFEFEGETYYFVKQ